MHQMVKNASHCGDQLRSRDGQRGPVAPRRPRALVAAAQIVVLLGAWLLVSEGLIALCAVHCGLRVRPFAAWMIKATYGAVLILLWRVKRHAAAAVPAGTARERPSP